MNLQGRPAAERLRCVRRFPSRLIGRRAGGALPTRCLLPGRTEPGMKRAEALQALVDMIESVDCRHPLRVGIDGVDCAGKTVLADELAELLRASGREVVRASVDGFHNPRAVRHRRGRGSPEGYYLDSFDLDTLLSDLLLPLGPSGNRRFRTAAYDWRKDREVCAPVRTAGESSVLLFDGVFLQRPELAGCWDLSVYVQVRFDTSLRRGMRRDCEALGGRERAAEAYRLRYLPAQRRYIRTHRPHERADVVFHNDDPRFPERVFGGGQWGG